MKTPHSVDSNRRELLRLGSLGLAASAISAIPASADAPKKGVSVRYTPAITDVTDFGAKGDGKAVDSKAINSAIRAVNAGGGGTVIVPAGDFLCFSIQLKSNVDLFLSQGARIIAADSPKPGEATGYRGGTYDPAEPNTAWNAYQDYGHNHWHNSLFWGEDLSNISITGPGIIWGRGLSWGAEAGAGRTDGTGFSPERTTTAPTTPAPAARPAAPAARGRGDYPVYHADQPGVANKTIALKNCRNVLFRDFSILKGGHFGLLLTGVDNVTIDNLTIDTDRDGIDIDCCKNVHVSNCTINSPWDDAIVPTSSFALGYNRSCDNLTIANCFVTGAYRLGTVLDGTWKKFTQAEDRKVGGIGRIKFGTESNGGFRNVSVSNCVFEGCHGLALETVDGALLEDFSITGITMRDIISCPIFMRLGARLRGPRGTGDQSTVVGTLKRILIQNLNCYNTAVRYGSHITGIPDHAVEDIQLSNIYVEHSGGGTEADAKIVVPDKENAYPEPTMFGTLPAHGFYLRHINRLSMNHVEIRPTKPDARPAIYTDDVHRADFIDITAPSSPAAFAFNRSTDIRVRMSRAAEDQTIA